jgi:ADP-ribose pyrophosphatase
MRFVWMPFEQIKYTALEDVRNGDNMEEIRRIKRELVNKGHILDYYHDTMSLPNGNQVVWDYIQHKGAAAVVAVLDDGRLLMVRQYRNALERETMEIPAGALNTPDEPTQIAAARELSEETGYTSDNLELLLSIRTTVAFCNEKIDIYLARDLKPGKQHLDEDEFLNVEAYPLDELLDKIYNFEIQDSKTVSAILAYAHRNARN